MKLEGNELRDYIERYADTVAPNGKWKQNMFFIGKYIPEKKLKNAVASYAGLSDGEIPLVLVDDTLFGSAKEGLLLTTANLYYNVILKPGKSFEKGKGCIPLSNIQSAFFDSGNFTIGEIAASGTIFYINSIPFGYLVKESFADMTVLNDLFSKLNTTEYVDSKLQNKPIWAFDGEEIIREIKNSHGIEFVNFSDSEINGGKWKVIVTNARIVRISDGSSVRASDHYSPELFFDWIELSEVRDILPAKKGFEAKLVLELKGGRKPTFLAQPALANAIRELRMYVGAALKRMVPVIMFEDPDEKILFKERALSRYGAFCSEAFWEMIFGDATMNARFCVTNKRLLFYRVNQVSGIRGDISRINYNVTFPSIHCIWLPLSCITGMTKEKKGLFHTIRLSIRKCAPAGEISPSPVIPDLGRQNGAFRYDPAYANAIGGAAVLDFDHLLSLSKQERQEVSEILRSLLPGIERPEI